MFNINYRKQTFFFNLSGQSLSVLIDPSKQKTPFSLIKSPLLWQVFCLHLRGPLHIKILMATSFYYYYIPAALPGVFVCNGQVIADCSTLIFDSHV